MVPSVAGYTAQRQSGRPDGSWRGLPPSITITPVKNQSACRHPLTNVHRPSTTRSAPSGRAFPVGAKAPAVTKSLRWLTISLATAGSSHAKKVVPLPIEAVQPAAPSALDSSSTTSRIVMGSHSRPPSAAGRPRWNNPAARILSTRSGAIVRRCSFSNARSLSSGARPRAASTMVFGVDVTAAMVSPFVGRLPERTATSANGHQCNY
jgi:hypothetical protein